MTKYAVYYYRDISKVFDYLQEYDLSNLYETHAPIPVSVEADSLDDVYLQMQGEVWSPNGSQRELIKSLGLHHTSLSMGDIVCVRDADSVEFYMCDWSRWKRLERKTE